MIVMTRRLTFAAAHLEGNIEGTGTASARVTTDGMPAPGHRITGASYTLDVAVRGNIDPKTGILVNIKEIDRIVRDKIVQVYEQKLIDTQVEDFRGQPVTLETLVLNILIRLKDALPAAVQLEGVRLASAPTRVAEWRANETWRNKEAGSMLMTRGYEFAASHRLHSPHLSAEENRHLFGKCNYEHGHGHNYELEVTVAGPIEPGSGRVLDPECLDAIVQRQVVDRYDHRHFNYDIPEFAGLIPSAEVITKVIWERLVAQIPSPARLYRVLLRETARNIFEYYGEA